MRRHPLIKLAMGGTTLRNWDGDRGELANEIERVARAYGQPVKILHVETKLGGDLVPAYGVRRPWSWHMVAVVNGLVLDPWCPWVPRPPAEYLARVFPGQPILAELFSDDGPLEVVCDTLPKSAVADRTQARRIPQQRRSAP